MEETQTNAPVVDTSSAPADTSVDTNGSQDASQAAAVPAPTVAEKKRIKRLELKIDGESSFEDLPFEIDEDQAEYMKKNLQLSKKAQKSMSSEAQMKQQIEQLVNMSKEDKKEFLKTFGIDPRELAAEIVEEEIRKQQMTPEQLKQAELESELKALKAQREKERVENEERERTTLEKQLYDKYTDQILASITKTDLPQERYVIKRIADYMAIGLENGVEITPDEVAPMVRDEIHAELQHLIKSLGEDKVENFIGKDVLSKIRKKNISKAKVVTAASAKNGVDTGKKSTDAKPVDKVSIKDFFGRM